MLASNSYIARVSEPRVRHILLSINEGSMTAGMMIGNLINGPVIEKLGLDVMAYTNAGICVLTAAVVAMLVKPIEYEHPVGWREALKPSHLIDTFLCVLKRRKNHGRLFIQLIYVIIAVAMFASPAFSSLAFLYLTKDIGISLISYSVFTSVDHGSKAVCSTFILLVVKWMGWDLMNTAVMALAAGVVGYIVMSLTPSMVVIWIGMIMCSITIAAFPILRSQLVSLCDADEVGRIYTYDAILHNVFKNLGSIFFNFMYGATVDVWPGMYLAMSAFLTCVSLVVMATFSLLKVKYGSK